MAFIHQYPPVVALSQEPMPVTVATTQVTSARARIELTIAATGPVQNETLTLSWSGKTVKFTFTATPDTSGLQLPICDPTLGLTPRYVHQLAAAFISHEWMSDQFETIIDAQPAHKITFKSRFDTPLSITFVAIVTNCTLIVTDAQSPYLKPNLTAALKVVSRKGREYAKLTGNYHIEKGTLTPYEGHSTFDISSLFDLAAHLPDDKTLDPSVPFQKGIAFRAYAQYFLRYADKYGSPPIAEALQRTTPAWAIYGGRSAATDRPFAADANGFYRCEPSQKSTVTRHQPNWLYFFPTKRIAKVVVNIRFWLSNGQKIEVWHSEIHTLNANRLHYYRTGFDQLQLATAIAIFVDPSAVVAYDWQLVDGTTQEVYLSHRYDLENCRFDSLYLAYSNGLGGIDTVHCKGSYAEKTEAERTIVRRTAEAVRYDTRLGALATTDAQLQKVWEIQTGLVTPQYADQLRQLLVGDVWLIDTNNKRFLRLIADTKSIETNPRGNGMISLALTFKSAWFEPNAV